MIYGTAAIPITAVPSPRISSSWLYCYSFFCSGFLASLHLIEAYFYDSMLNGISCGLLYLYQTIVSPASSTHWGSSRPLPFCEVAHLVLLSTVPLCVRYSSYGLMGVCVIPRSLLFWTTLLVDSCLLSQLWKNCARMTDLPMWWRSIKISNCLSVDGTGRDVLQRAFSNLYFH